MKDILQELEKTLKTLLSQATKAKKYQEYQAKLKELRIGLGLREFQEIAETLTYQEELLRRLRGEVNNATVRIETGETELSDLDATLARTDDSLRSVEKQLGESRQTIAEQEAAAKSQREQTANLESELLRIGRQRADLHSRLLSLSQESSKAASDAAKASEEAAGEQHRADAAAAALNVVTAIIAEFSRQIQAARDEQFSLVGRAAQLKSTEEMTAAQVERLQKELVRKNAEGEKATAEADAIRRVMADLSQSNTAVLEKLAEAKTALEILQQQQSEQRRRAEALQPKLDASRDRRGDLRGRADVLEQLERSFEGLGAGVRGVLERTKSSKTAILGLVADLLTVPREYAPLIDLALGDVSQRFVVRDAESLDAIVISLGDLPGRVGFIPLTGGGRESSDTPTPLESAIHGIDLNAAPAKNREADASRSPINFVSSPLPGLVEQLLGHVILVDSLKEARKLEATHTGCRFVSKAGEVLESDGTVVVGPPGGDAGILSRKSELRDLREQLAALDDEVFALEAEQASLRQQSDALEAPIGGRTAEIAALSAKAGDLRDSLTAQREKQTRLGELVELVASEAAILGSELQKAEAALHQTARDSSTAEAAAETLRATLEATESQLRQAEATREGRQQENTAAQVALSRAKQQATALATRKQELDIELRQRGVEEKTLASAHDTASTRLTDCQLAALRATALAATAFAQKEQHERAVSEWTVARNDVRARRESVQDDLKQIRDAWKSRQDQAHAHELTVRDLTNRRESIAARIREDYSLELAELPAAPLEGSDDELHNEIDELKRKTARLGSVNLEALEQLATEETREKSLRAEFNDLTEAEASLLQIIETINQDSRRLFAEMFGTVRVHFQELFRKLFGGGMADIILEDETDVLESGIEIIARPPGKELRSISLMSGGEKTLTAVALLLAIFRSKPSPFCMLDEVDAALDEANIGRLAVVLREFLDHSQFIIITHKKRTMAMADVLYGITMQEIGRLQAGGRALRGLARRRTNRERRLKNC